MRERWVIAFSVALFGAAVWQWISEQGDDNTVQKLEQAMPVAPVPAPDVVKAPRSFVHKNGQPAIPPFKYDPRNYKQNTEFFLGLSQDNGGDAITLNAPGNSGPFDSNGNLIMPIDTRKMH